MDTDRKHCNRPTCGNKTKCTQMNKDAKRSPMTLCRPGAEPAKAATPNVGNSTQILFVDSNFTETPSEYDTFYDCYSDVEISQTKAVVSSMCGLSVPPPPVKDSRMFRDALKQVILTAQTLLVDFDRGGRKERRGCGSRCRCDVRNIKPHTQTVQLEVTAKVATNKSSTPQNIRIDPITFTIPLKLHVQGQHQHNIPYSVSHQSNEFRKPPPPAMLDRDPIPNMFASMEPIRTAIITAPRQEINSIPMEGSGPAFNFQSALLQQMVGIPPGFLQLPLPGAEGLIAPPPSKGVSSKLQIQVPPPPPLMTLGGPDETTMVKTKKTCKGTCSVRRQQVASAEAFLSPSLAPVTKGPFLTTITTSSVPSVGAGKSPQVSETRSQGVCVLCGRGGEQPSRQMDASVRAPCGVCSKGKFIMPQPQPGEFHRPIQKTGTFGEYSRCDKTTESLVVLVPPAMPKSAVRTGAELSSNTCPFTSLQKQMEMQRPYGAACPIGPSLLKPQQQDNQINIEKQQHDVKRPLKGPCGMCSTEVPAPPPFDEPFFKSKGPCGVCSKPKPAVQKSQEEKIRPLTTPSEHIKPKGICSNRQENPCEICPKKSAAPNEFGNPPCGVCSKAVVVAVKTEKTPCGICSKKSMAPIEVMNAPCGISSKAMDEPVTLAKTPCGICSKAIDVAIKTEKTPCGICSKKSTAPMEDMNAPCGVCLQMEKPPCGICSKKSTAPMEDMNAPCGVCLQMEKPPCGICSKKSTTAMETIKPCGVCTELEKPPCGICSKRSEAPMEMKTSKVPCGICSKRSVTPIEVVKGPCGVCSKSVDAPVKTGKAPCGICSKTLETPIEVVKGPCGVCSKSVKSPAKTETAPCGICSKRSAGPVTVVKGPCGVCSKAVEEPIKPTKPCGICSKDATAPLEVETGPCGICSRGVTPFVIEEIGPCGICSRGVESTVTHDNLSAPMQEIMGPCGICSQLVSGTPTVEAEETEGPCNICKKGPTKPDSRDICGICKKMRAPESQAISAVAPCQICGQGPTTTSAGRTCGTCNFTPSSPSSGNKSCGSCLVAPPKSSNIRTCGTCMLQPPTRSGRTCGTCMVIPTTEAMAEISPKVESVEHRVYKALPQHKDIHICSPCRYDPSPLIDEEGNVFCPHNCGCCLCPWRKRATDSQIDQIKHEKIKVCKCRMKGSIFADYTSRAKCSNTSYFDCCPCRERAEAKYLEMTGEEMWSPDDKLKERVRGEPVNLEDVVEYKRTSTQ
ncbi:nascent polypeptide-associated complex subunit alpha, muscle-specific form [Bactrocera neohumeralis]|uniref:nascent polypeptide-associated complex subunit alpha, muscle-specific form n=1 Tax=Bactrocera neohumeralis TaxID=98809 RepID=UPI00216601D2|nr:nascent polypeptide-associated complex subunit alpha, muscle-specific form [Bactrocera neohumeralis]